LSCNSNALTAVGVKKISFAILTLKSTIFNAKSARSRLKNRKEKKKKSLKNWKTGRYKNKESFKKKKRKNKDKKKG